MTDLTTMHLKCLLEKATPGAWKADDSFFPEYITTNSGHYVLWNTNEEAWWSNKDEDVHLAALAPQLARELIRLREHIEGLITAMEDKATTGDSQSPAVIAGYLKEIVLGEPNG